MDVGRSVARAIPGTFAWMGSARSPGRVAALRYVRIGSSADRMGAAGRVGRANPIKSAPMEFARVFRPVRESSAGMMVAVGRAAVVAMAACVRTGHACPAMSVRAVWLPTPYAWSLEVSGIVCNV